LSVHLLILVSLDAEKSFETKTKNEETLTMQTRLDGCWRTSLPRLFPASNRYTTRVWSAERASFFFSKAAQRNGMFGAIG
jgi:hypothetical protein